MGVLSAGNGKTTVVGASLRRIAGRALPAELATNSWHHHASKALQRAHQLMIRQVGDDGPATCMIQPIKQADGSGRAQPPDRDVAGETKGLDVPSAKFEKCSAAVRKILLGGRLQAPSAVAVAAVHTWSRVSAGELGNDQGGKQ